MASLKGLIIALVILGIGIYAIQMIGQYFLSQPGLPKEVGAFAELIAGFRGLTNLILMGIGALVVLLIIVSVARRRPKEKKAASMPAYTPRPEPKKKEEDEGEYHEIEDEKE